MSEVNKSGGLEERAADSTGEKNSKNEQRKRLLNDSNIPQDKTKLMGSQIVCRFYKCNVKEY